MKNTAKSEKMGSTWQLSEIIYQDLRLRRKRTEGQDVLEARFKVKNNGSQHRADAAGLFIRHYTSEDALGASKLMEIIPIDLQPGERQEIICLLDKKSFACYMPEENDWVVNTGRSSIGIHNSDGEICLSRALRGFGTENNPHYYTAFSPLDSLEKTEQGQVYLKDIMEQLATRKAHGADQMLSELGMELPLGALVTLGMMEQPQLDNMLNLLNA